VLAHLTPLARTQREQVISQR